MIWAICHEDFEVESNVNEENVDNEDDVYLNLTSEEALESFFYKIKDFINDNNSERLSKILDFEDDLYIAIDKLK